MRLIGLNNFYDLYDYFEPLAGPEFALPNIPYDPGQFTKLHLHCLPVSLCSLEMFGGELLSVTLPSHLKETHGSSHFLCGLKGAIYDLTVRQFPCIIDYSKVRVVDKSRYLNNSRYLSLSRKIKSGHK